MAVVVAVDVARSDVVVVANCSSFEEISVGEDRNDFTFNKIIITKMITTSAV